MLSVSDISKRYGEKQLFNKVSFVINHGERVGLVGPNGCGKTTLLRILLGQERPDSGGVRFTIPMDKVGYLPQAFEQAGAISVKTYLMPEETDSASLSERIQELADQLCQAKLDDRTQVEAEYAAVVDMLEAVGMTVQEHDLTEILHGLSLDDINLDQSVAILSGGQKTRLGLAQLLLRRPSILVLDEPTNHLDITGLEWLEAYLSRYRGAQLIVSHDRTFLDQTVTRILELDPQSLRVTSYAGNYTAYTEAKQREKDAYERTYKEQQVRVAQLQGSVRTLEGQARNIEGETIDFYWRKRALKVARQAVVQRKRIERMLASEDHLEKPQLSWDMKLEFLNTPSSGQDVLILEHLSKGFGNHLLFSDANLWLRRQERVVLVGPNGCGKTTLLRMIIGQEQATNGVIRLGANVKIGYLSQGQEQMDPQATPFDLVRGCAALSETEARGFLHYFLFSGDKVFVPAGSLSYGERARLALGMLVLQECNLLLLDEPTNHLDIPSREHFERALASFSGTVLAVVHDRYFTQRYATAVWAVTDGTIRRYVDLAEMRQTRQQPDAKLA
ncbi:MAG: ribosomal protection-like ABC-F family protein [Anaerolineae bacterium]